jgi:heme a synthase
VRLAQLPRPRLSPRAYRALAVVTLASLVFIVVTGAAVRLTGSGLGCTTWPNCDADSFAPRTASDTHGMVEWVNRMITGAVMLFTLAAVVGARWRRPYRRDLYLVSLGLPAWVLANAVVGGLVVIFSLTPVAVIGHFILSLGAVANAVVLWERSSWPDVPVPAESGPGAGPVAAAPRPRAATPALVGAVRGLVAAGCLVLITGTIVTGSGPHAGDERAHRLPFQVHDVARVHGIAMVIFLATTLWVIRRADRGDAAPAVSSRLHILLVVLVGQAAIGYWQYFTGVPALLVGFHVFGATLVWVCLLRVLLAVVWPAPSVAQLGDAPEPALTRATMGTW